MGFLKRLFSGKGRKDKSKRARLDAPPPVPEVPPQTPPNEDETEATITRLLRSSSMRHELMRSSEVDTYLSLPSPNPNNDRSTSRSTTPPELVSRPVSPALSTSSGPLRTYSVVVHERTVHKPAQFSKSSPPSLVELRSSSTSPDSMPPWTTSVDAAAEGDAPTDASFAPGDVTRLVNLRTDPSVATLLNMYDEHGRINSAAFADGSIEHDQVGRLQAQRTGSTLRMLLGGEPESESRRGSVHEGDISWAERLLGEHIGNTSMGSSTSSLPLVTPTDAKRFSIAMVDDSTDSARPGSPIYPTFSSMDVELSTASDAMSMSSKPSDQSVCSPTTPAQESAPFAFLADKKAQQARALPPIAIAAPTPIHAPTPAHASAAAESPVLQPASEVFAFLLNRRQSHASRASEPHASAAGASLQRAATSAGLSSATTTGPGLPQPRPTSSYAGLPVTRRLSLADRTYAPAMAPGADGAVGAPVRSRSQTTSASEVLLSGRGAAAGHRRSMTLGNALSGQGQAGMGVEAAMARATSAPRGPRPPSRASLTMPRASSRMEERTDDVDLHINAGIAAESKGLPELPAPAPAPEMELSDLVPRLNTASRVPATDAHRRASLRALSVEPLTHDRDHDLLNSSTATSAACTDEPELAEAEVRRAHAVTVKVSVGHGVHVSAAHPQRPLAYVQAQAQALYQPAYPVQQQEPMQAQMQMQKAQPGGRERPGHRGDKENANAHGMPAASGSTTIAKLPFSTTAPFAPVTPMRSRSRPAPAKRITVPTVPALAALAAEPVEELPERTNSLKVPTAPPSPASSAEMSPLGRQLMANVREQRMRARERELAKRRERERSRSRVRV